MGSGANDYCQVYVSLGSQGKVQRDAVDNISKSNSSCRTGNPVRGFNPYVAFLYSMFNIGAGVLIVFVNKLVFMYGFKFVVALTWIHAVRRLVVDRSRHSCVDALRGYGSIYVIVNSVV